MGENMLFIDQMILDEKPRITADGYLVASPRVARTGIQDYLGVELGRPDLQVVKVYRPESEVFSKDALHSFAHRPVTIDHPPVLVDSRNWKKYSRGQTGGDVARDGEFIRVPMSLMDAEAIKDVESGKVEISMGYTADLVWESGVSETGEHYDAIQTNIRGNHLAIVDAARGGSKLRVIDTSPKQEELFMPKSIVVDGITVEVSDTAAQVVEKTIKTLTDKAKTDEEKMKSLEDEIAELKEKMKKDKETVEAKDGEIAALKQQVADAAMTPEKLDLAVKARAAVIDSARKILPSVVVDGKSEADIRRQVVAAKLGDEAVKDKADAYIDAAYDVLAKTGGSVDPYRQAVRDGGSNVVDSGKARDAYKQSLADRHPSSKKAGA